MENAIKYAVTPRENGADIWLTATHAGPRVRIEVADNGEGGAVEIAASPSTGVGLANIRDRLSQAYGGDAPVRGQGERSGGLQRYHRTSL